MTRRALDGFSNKIMTSYCGILIFLAVQLSTGLAEDGNKTGRYIYGGGYNLPASYVTSCPFAGCMDVLKQIQLSINVRGSGGIARPPCYCTAQECPQCSPHKTRPARVFQGEPGMFGEPDELAWGCNRWAACVQPPTCTICYPDQPAYDSCICYGPGICTCWIKSAGLIAQEWPQPKPPCYCEPQICQGCPPMGVDIVADIKGTINMANDHAVAASHGCDWSLPCVPAPICHGCLQITHDHCICYGKGICVCYETQRKPPCYCQKQVCPRCFMEKGYPSQISTRSYTTSVQTHGNDVIATACNMGLPCQMTPPCRPCAPTDLRYETCLYYGPGISACYVGKAVALGGIYGK